jgi:hypothetical protein
MGYVKKVALPMQGDQAHARTSASCCRTRRRRHQLLANMLHLRHRRTAYVYLTVHNQEPVHRLSAETHCRCPADLILFTATANTSIVTLNLSLLLNKVGFYQARCTAWHLHTCSRATDPVLTGLPARNARNRDAHSHRCSASPQIAKLLIIPFVCLVEHFWLGKRFSVRVIMSVVTVVLGVGVV